MARFIEYEGRQWPISQLARSHGLKPSTLSGRIKRFGETATGIHRSLATGLLTASQAGSRGASRSPWRYAV